MDQRTDEDLLEAHRNGDSKALEALIGRYQRELLGFLTRLLGNRSAAEDVFQEAFLQIHLSADSFDTSRRFRPWLFTIAANKGRDYYRKHGKQDAAADLSAPVKGRGGSAGDGSSATKFVDLLEADVPDLEVGIESAETRDRVRWAVDQLPLSLREIILLAYFQRMSYKQIAESLDIPLGTVKSRLHTAVATFTELWNQSDLSSPEEPIENRNDSINEQAQRTGT